MSKFLHLFKRVIYPRPCVSQRKAAKRYKGTWVVVTGASRGIGQALARRLMEAGANLFLIARSEEELQTLCREAEAKGCQARYRAVDLRSHEELESLCQQLRTELGGVSAFFCNAGKSIQRSIKAAEDRLHDYDRTMDLNYRSMVGLALALMPRMREAGGCIVYSSSVSTLYPAAPRWSAYHASKSAANTWLETARMERRKTGVNTKIAYLPLVHTAMSDATEAYRSMPAYEPDEAAGLLLRLSLNHRATYKPWWARITAPLSHLVSPLVKWYYMKFY